MGELHLEILRDRIEIDYGLKTELGKMRVAFRESFSETVTHEMELDQVIGSQKMYAKLKLTIEPVELNTELLRELKEKFDNNMKTQEAPAFDISQTQSQQNEVDKNENDIIFSFQDLKPFSEKVKLENDDSFIKGKIDKDKRKEIQAAASQGFEMFRSLESLSFDIFEELLQ